MEIIDYVKQVEGLSNEERKRVICRKLDDLGITYKVHKYDTGENIIIKSGLEKEVGIASHFDVVVGSPGANDNGSAVAVTLDVLRKYTENPTKKVGVRGLFFDEEEYWLRGSRAYIREGGLNDLIGLYNMELVGFGNRIALWSDEKLKKGKLLKTFEKQAKIKNIKTHRFPYIRKMFQNTGDHLSFNEVGFNEAFCITSVTENDVKLALKYIMSLGGKASRENLVSQSLLFKDYHKPTDTSDKLDENTLKMVSDLLWNSVCEIDKKFN